MAVAPEGLVNLRDIYRRWFPPRARLIPFVPGGPLCISTIVGLYRTYRRWGSSRPRALYAAVCTEWAAWRYSRSLQKPSRSPR